MLTSRKLIQNIWPVLFFLLLLFNAFSRTATLLKEPSLITLDYTYYIGLILFVFFIVVKKEIFLRKASPLNIGLGLFVLVNIVMHIIKGNLSNSEAIFHMLLYLTFFIAMALIQWKPEHFIIFAHVSMFLVILIIIHWVFLDLPNNRFTSYFTNPNVSGIFFSCLLFFLVAGFMFGRVVTKIYFFIGITAALILIYVSTARAVLLLLMVALGARIILSISRKLFSFLFYFVMAANLLFFLIYSLMAKSNYAQSLNAWSIERFKKNFFSGRQEIWEPSITHGLKSPFWGHKIGILPKDFMDGTHYVHTHNQYLQIFLESGLVGLACFFALLYGIWKVYLRGLDSKIVRLSACFFLGLLVYQSVEISFFFNMEAIGLLHWMILALGISAVINKSENKGKQPYNQVKT
ncbi:Lipid A core - O-antigen ligase and related enzymes [Bacillus freudenreichii]|nr:Lipid A core - O-antigen ligase and related enzymes [Bacillus freudenreichii]